MWPMAKAMVSTVRPNARATPSTPIPNGEDAAITALPQPPNTNQNVPNNSVTERLNRDMRSVLDSPAIETASSCASLQTYYRFPAGTLAEYSRLFADFQQTQKNRQRPWLAGCGGFIQSGLRKSPVGASLLAKAVYPSTSMGLTDCFRRIAARSRLAPTGFVSGRTVNRCRQTPRSDAPTSAHTTRDGRAIQRGCRSRRSCRFPALPTDPCGQ